MKYKNRALPPVDVGWGGVRGTHQASPASWQPLGHILGTQGLKDHTLILGDILEVTGIWYSDGQILSGRRELEIQAQLSQYEPWIPPCLVNSVLLASLKPMEGCFPEKAAWSPHTLRRDASFERLRPNQFKCIYGDI